MTDTKHQEGGGYSRSDKELIELFMTALSTRSELRLLRIGGPRGFRNAIIAASAEVNALGADPFVSALLSPEIPFIKVLFADPDGEPFLKRLDQEGASCWKIWRVRKQLLQLVRSMLALGARRPLPGSLVVGFHRDDLIWNLGLVGKDDALVRPYGHGTGHDESVLSHRIKPSGTDDLLAGAFFKYFEALSTRLDTAWIRPEILNIEAAAPRWPSLYKGNAILASNADTDGTAEPDLGADEVCKICLDPRANEAEERWLGLKESLRATQTNFRPGTVIKGANDFRGHGVIVSRIPGPSLFDLAACLNTASTPKNSPLSASSVLDIILEDSMKALFEFRDLTEKILPRGKRVTYPYAAKLTSAINEIRKYCVAIPEDVWRESIEDSLELGEELEQLAQVPFRDAHLKNRLWQDSRSALAITESLLAVSLEEVLYQVKGCVKDIDFETAFYDVTQWDDPFHIIMFEYSTLGRRAVDSHAIDVWNRFKTHLGSVSDRRVWRTGLARATREFARRLWYHSVMPNAYARRYSTESPDFFLRLALECSSRCSGYLKLRRLLEALEAHCNFGGLGSLKYDTHAPPLHSQGVSLGFEPPLCMPLVSHCSVGPESFQRSHGHGHALRVFISYSHHDEQHRQKLERTLVLLKRSGLVETWSDRCLAPGEEWDSKIDSELNAADVIIFLVSLEFLASSYCFEVEVSSALKRHAAGAATVVPIIVRPVPLKHTEFSHIQAVPRDGKAITTWQHEDEAWVDVEQSIRDVCLRGRGLG